MPGQPIDNCRRQQAMTAARPKPHDGQTHRIISQHADAISRDCHGKGEGGDMRHGAARQQKDCDKKTECSAREIGGGDIAGGLFGDRETIDPACHHDRHEAADPQTVDGDKSHKSGRRHGCGIEPLPPAPSVYSGSLVRHDPTFALPSSVPGDGTCDFRAAAAVCRQSYPPPSRRSSWRAHSNCR